MDLHAWTTQQVDRAEASARDRLKGLRVAFEPHDGGPAITGTVTGAMHTAEGLQLDVAQYGAELVGDAWENVPSVAAVLRRCEADRRILARHRLDPDITYEPACKGCGTCGTYGDCDLSNVDNLNECPELLDLAHAHGLTDEILAELDRPQPPEPTPAQKRRLRERARLTVPITTSDVPEALRGARWKP